MPADVYTRSARIYRGLDELTYPFHDPTVMVTNCGRICFDSRKINLSQVFAGQEVGVSQVDDRVWLVWLEPIENPFGPRVLPLSSAAE